jgi:hypothetical protein
MNRKSERYCTAYKNICKLQGRIYLGSLEILMIVYSFSILKTFPPLHYSYGPEDSHKSELTVRVVNYISM